MSGCRWMPGGVPVSQGRKSVGIQPRKKKFMWAVGKMQDVEVPVDSRWSPGGQELEIRGAPAQEKEVHVGCLEEAGCRGAGGFPVESRWARAGKP